MIREALAAWARVDAALAALEDKSAPRSVALRDLVLARIEAGYATVRAINAGRIAGISPDGTCTVYVDGGKAHQGKIDREGRISVGIAK